MGCSYAMKGEQNRKFLTTAILIALTITILGFILPVSVPNKVVKVSSENVVGKTNITVLRTFTA